MEVKKKVLVVEDSPMLSMMLTQKIENELLYEVVAVHTFADARRVLREGNDQYFISLLDLVLPDARDGEIIDLVEKYNIPIIVFTATLNDDVRDRILSRNIMDYVLKDNVKNIDYIVQLINRIHKNQSVHVLVVDDSKTSRKYISLLLERYYFNVVEVNNGKAALEYLMDHPEVKMVITDHEMPEMNGAELTRAIRKKYSKDKLAIIGVSAYGSGALSARLLKLGCNDFLNKPFLNEEFYCRVTQNLEMMDYIETISEAAFRDFLTGLHNRRYFYHVGNKLFENALRGNIPLVFAMIDIDYFKKINDRFGHEAGDLVLRKISRILKDNTRKADILVRMGGEEFCIMATIKNNENVFMAFDKLRQKIEEIYFSFHDEVVKATVSIGVSTYIGESMDESLKFADKMLYQAKDEGRNRVKVYHKE